MCFGMGLCGKPTGFWGKGSVFYGLRVLRLGSFFRGKNKYQLVETKPKSVLL